MPEPFYLTLLKNELSSRKEKNTRYSLGSFALALGTTPATLSRILNRKRGVALPLANQFAEKLDLSRDQKKKFIQSIGEVKAGPFLGASSGGGSGIKRPVSLTSLTHALKAVLDGTEDAKKIAEILLELQKAEIIEIISK